MKKRIIISITIIIAGIILLTSFSSAFTTTKIIHQKTTKLTETELDIQYIYNITKALSYIIFTEYDEENGEIAKGRAFGSKGEHKAAEILYDNMTLLGLETSYEQLDSRPGIEDDFLITKLDVLDYEAKINDELVDCYIAPSWKGPSDNPDQLDYNYSYSDLKIIPLPRFPCLYQREYANMEDGFVFIGKNQCNDPNGVMPVIDMLKPFLDPLKFYMLFHVIGQFKIQIETAMWKRFYPNCKGLVLYDFNVDCHDMKHFVENGNSVPVIYINGSNGNSIMNNTENFSLDFDLDQRFNDSVISYNVIGEIKGTDEEKTIILSCLYDSWWCQGTADSAIGMAMVLGIAKYFVESGITPKYNLKFIGFSGEEYDLRGARYYEAIHKEENILAVLDLNQLGFTQNEPRLTLDFVANKLRFLNNIMDIVDESNYIERTGNVTDVRDIWWPSGLIPGNAGAFAVRRPLCNAMTIFKDGGWVLHHRDGLNHKEGDVLEYFNWTDTQVTAEIALNITKSLVSDEYELDNHQRNWFELLKNEREGVILPISTHLALIS